MPRDQIDELIRVLGEQGIEPEPPRGCSDAPLISGSPPAVQGPKITLTDGAHSSPRDRPRPSHPPRTDIRRGVYSRTTGAQDPYFLYAVSNSGSLLALLAYPLIVEPELPLDLQATLWSIGFGLLVLGIALCAAIMLSHKRPSASVMVREARTPVSARHRLMWMVLAFIPSSLLLGVTEHITADIASAPLLWVVPLILYLLTFIFAFARRPPLPHAIMVRAFPTMLILAVITRGVEGPTILHFALDLSCFFIVAMVCHGELAKRRPPAGRLTEFYLFLSLGGVLGGVFNALGTP